MQNLEKFDLTNCSIVIPIHIDCKERLEHIQFLYSYFEKFFIHYELIVVEQGKTSQVPLHSSLRFVQSDERFSTAEISNIGASFVTKPFFCKYDVDALIHPRALFTAFEKLKSESELAMIFPYNSISFTIQNPLREELMGSFDFKDLPTVSKKQLPTWSGESIYIKNDHSTGLIHLFRTSVFKELGGYNEEFIGWGYEDDEIAFRFAKMKANPQYLEGYNAYHLDHPRVPGDAMQALKNQFLSQVVKNMDVDDLCEYIKSWNRFAKILAK